MARNAQRRARAPARPARVASGASRAQAAAQGNVRTIAWRQCFAGLVVGEALLLLFSNLGLLVANAAFGASGGQHADGGIVGVSTLIAVIAGAFLAAKLAGHHGLYQGIVVGCGFIVWGAIFQFLQEASVVASSISAGGHTLVDLGPMDMGSLISGDLLALFGGTVGGLLSGKR